MKGDVFLQIRFFERVTRDFIKMKGFFLQFTWIPFGKVEVGEIDNVVSFLLLLVEESQFCRSSDNIVSYDTLIKRG